MVKRLAAINVLIKCGSISEHRLIVICTSDKFMRPDVNQVAESFFKSNFGCSPTKISSKSTMDGQWWYKCELNQGDYVSCHAFPLSAGDQDICVSSVHEMTEINYVE